MRAYFSQYAKDKLGGSCFYTNAAGEEVEVTHVGEAKPVFPDVEDRGEVVAWARGEIKSLEWTRTHRFEFKGRD